jgi:hypothetical protein
MPVPAFFSSTAPTSVANLSGTHSLAEGDGNGIFAIGTNATLWLALSTVTENAAGFSASGGRTINSYGDNYLAANGANTGSLASVGEQ